MVKGIWGSWVCVDVILSCKSLQFLVFYSLKSRSVSHISSCAAYWPKYELLKSVSGAFFVWDDHTYKVDSCKILHDVFTVQRLTVATWHNQSNKQSFQQSPTLILNIAHQEPSKKVISTHSRHRWATHSSSWLSSCFSSLFWSPLPPRLLCG